VSAVGLRSSRNRELGLLLLVAALVAVGFTSVLVARSGVVSSLSLTYAAAFLALLGVAHIALRVALPDADPVLHAVRRILVLQLGCHLGNAAGGEKIDAHERRIADEFGHVRCDVHGLLAVDGPEYQER
jgi:hypothetical protein